MFQFPALPPRRLCVRRRGTRPSPGGFPHSGTPGSKAACASPGSIAACRALRRLPVPRHPPCALGTPPPGGACHCSDWVTSTRPEPEIVLFTSAWLCRRPGIASQLLLSALCGSQGARGRCPEGRMLRWAGNSETLVKPRLVTSSGFRRADAHKLVELGLIFRSPSRAP